MTKKLILKISISFLLIVLLISGFLFIPIYLNAKNAIVNETNNGEKLSGSRSTKIIGGWNDYYSNEGKNEVIYKNFNPKNPVLYQVYARKNTTSTDLKMITLNRINLFDFEVQEYTYLSIEKPFPEAVAIAQKYDLSKENPDPENIKVQTPPSKAEVEDSKKRAEERKKEDKISEEKDYWNTYIKPSNSENKTEKKEFIEKYLKTLIEFKARREQDPTGTIEFYKIKCTPERAKTTEFKMCDFDDGIKLANQYLKELEEKK